MEKTSKSGTTSAIATQSEKLGFKVLTGESGTTLYFAKTEANYWKTQAILNEAGLEFYTRQEILLILTKDEKLKESLKGTWFYIAGVGLNTGLTLATIDEKGELVERKGTTALEMTVRVWDGKNPLCLVVRLDGGAAQGGGRFVVVANYGPDVVAPVVVGKAKAEPNPAQLARQLAKQAKEQLDGLLRQADEAEKSLDALKLATRPELLAPVENLIRTVKQLEIKG